MHGRKVDGVKAPNLRRVHSLAEGIVCEKSAQVARLQFLVRVTDKSVGPDHRLRLPGSALRPYPCARIGLAECLAHAGFLSTHHPPLPTDAQAFWSWRRSMFDLFANASEGMMRMQCAGGVDQRPVPPFSARAGLRA